MLKFMIKLIKSEKPIFTSGSDRVCFNCGNSVHESKNWSFKRYGAKCNEFGHIAVNCKNEPKPRYAKNDDVQICSVVKSGLMYKAVTINNCDGFKALVDTGSDVSIL